MWVLAHYAGGKACIKRPIALTSIYGQTNILGPQGVIKYDHEYRTPDRTRQHSP
jgi:hypothetical protein